MDRLRKREHSKRSDNKPASQTAAPRCRLCLEQRPLVRSHIIPEFFYRAMYDDKHRVISATSDAKQPVEWLQKGLRENLLCRPCENQLSVYESYGKSLFFGGQLDARRGQAHDAYGVERVDYTKFKLLQMSILWRAAVAQSGFFRSVQLGPHEDKLRQMIFREDPGEPHQYGCMLAALFQGNRPFQIVAKPETLRSAGHGHYRFFFGGYLWHYVVSSHSSRFEFSNLFLQPDGRLVFLKMDYHEVPELAEGARQLIKRSREVEALLSKKKGLDL
jgi:hypothetical protein